EIGLNLDEIPLVVQLNKRDLPNIADVDTMLNLVDPQRKYEHIESAAVSGVGVFETLKLISKLTLRTLRRRMTGEEPVRGGQRKVAEVATFRVQGEQQHGGRSSTGSMPKPVVGTPLPGPSFTNAVPAAAARVAAQQQPEVSAQIAEETIEEIVSAADIGEETPEPFDANVGDRILSEAPPLADIPPAAGPVPKAEPAMKHVKVRSTVDIMAELEALRKRATQAPPKAPKKDAAPREVRKSLSFSARDVAGRAKSVRVALSFEGEEGVLHKEEQVVELTDAPGNSSVNIDLKIDLE
ncbi:MAG: hypothetical protein ACXW2X_11600, partial [Thermoanaerobaculia bacterium]